MNEEWMKQVTFDMLPEGMCQAIAEAIGIDDMLRLCALIGGENFYLPKIDSFQRKLRDRKIREEYTGYNKKELCRKYKVSGRWIDQIIRQEQP